MNSLDSLNFSLIDWQIAVHEISEEQQVETAELELGGMEKRKASLEATSKIIKRYVDLLTKVTLVL